MLNVIWIPGQHNPVDFHSLAATAKSILSQGGLEATQRLHKQQTFNCTAHAGKGV